MKLYIYHRLRITNYNSLLWVNVKNLSRCCFAARLALLCYVCVCLVVVVLWFAVVLHHYLFIFYYY